MMVYVNQDRFTSINYQLSTINYQLSTINYQLSTVNCQLSTTIQHLKSWVHNFSDPPWAILKFHHFSCDYGPSKLTVDS